MIHGTKQDKILGQEFSVFLSKKLKKNFSLLTIQRIFGGASRETYRVVLKDDPHNPPFLHIQAISKIQIIEEGTTTEGCGVLEQLLIGRHKPSNFQDILDLAK